MREILYTTYTAALPIVLTALMGYVVWMLQAQKQEQLRIEEAHRTERDANSKGTMLLLRVQIIEYFDKWSERGYRTKHGTENVKEMYEAYHALGGNGMVEDLMKQINDLPIRDE